MEYKLPKPPSLFKTLGPTFILLGLALGSGELILWPYITAQYGLGLMWGAVLGISFQYVLNTEVMRYTLYRGESVFVGFKKMLPLLPIWFFVATFVPWGLPGFSSAASQILVSTFGFGSEKVFAIVFLLIAGLILSAGKFLYNTMETLQKTVIMLGLPFILILTYILTESADWSAFLTGLVGVGDNYLFFPSGVSIAAFLGAFAYSGAGGTLNLAQSYYVKEKGLGMGKYSTKISSLFSGGEKQVSIEGHNFKDTQANRKTWNDLWRVVNEEHFIVFWVLGFFTISILSVLSFSLLKGQQVGEGISFLFAQADAISLNINAFMGTLFLVVAFVMLFSTQVGVLESSSRIMSENILLMFYKKNKKFNLSLAFYSVLWAQIVFGIIVLLMGFTEPRFLLTLAAILNAAAMMVSFPLLYFLNNKTVKPYYKPNNFRVGVMAFATIFFAVFLVVVVRQNLL